MKWVKQKSIKYKEYKQKEIKMIAEEILKLIQDKDEEWEFQAIIIKIKIRKENDV